MTTRAATSLAVPAPSGTTTVTLRDGQSCADAAIGATQAAKSDAFSAARQSPLRVFIAFSPCFSLSYHETAEACARSARGARFAAEETSWQDRKRNCGS